MMLDDGMAFDSMSHPVNKVKCKRTIKHLEIYTIDISGTLLLKNLKEYKKRIITKNGQFMKRWKGGK